MQIGYLTEKCNLFPNAGHFSRKCIANVVPHKCKFLHLLSDFDEIMHETSLINTKITVAPQLAALYHLWL